MTTISLKESPEVRGLAMNTAESDAPASAAALLTRRG